MPHPDTLTFALQKEKLKSAKKAVEQLILSRHCNPIVVRLAWHDSGSYDKVCCRVLPFLAEAGVDKRSISKTLVRSLHT